MAPPDNSAEDSQLGHEETIEPDPSSTIRPAWTMPPATTLVSVDAGRAAGLSREALDGLVHLGDTLGEGGMGVVRAGTQQSLRRGVAVKTLRSERDDYSAVVMMVREAWVTGGLEHPNIVPVYDLTFDEDGRPLIILKRISGTEWSALMQSPHTVLEKFKNSDLLDWNLRIFLQVCNAIRFAHDHGVVHRDLKPDNVMVGAFGEVYVLDWGLAVSVEGHTSGIAPAAADARELAGTPHYMAPEMLGGTGVSRQTDIYLLGAILYEMLLGKPPHTGPSIAAVLESAQRSSPEVPSRVPDPLRQIVQQALSRDPANRQASVSVLHDEVLTFVSHRDSNRLSAEAQTRLQRLETHATSQSGTEADHRLELYSLYSACRFGFQQALASWPGNHGAEDGLRACVSTMVDYELRAGEPRAARALASDFETISPELGRRIDNAIAAQDAERRETTAFASVGRQEDARVGRGARVFLASLFGAIWALTPLTAFVFSPKPAHAYAVALGMPAVLLFLFLFGVAFTRKAMLATAFNRRIVAAVCVSLATRILHMLGMFILGVDIWLAHVGSLAVFSAIGAMAIATIDRRLWPLLVTLLAAFAATVAWPRGYYLHLALVESVLCANAVWIWRRPTLDRQESRAQTGATMT